MSYARRVLSGKEGKQKNAHACLTQLFRAYLAVRLYYVFITVRGRRNSRASGCCSRELAGEGEGGGGGEGREVSSARAINYPGSDYRALRDAVYADAR